MPEWTPVVMGVLNCGLLLWAVLVRGGWRRRIWRLLVVTTAAGAGEGLVFGRYGEASFWMVVGLLLVLWWRGRRRTRAAGERPGHLTAIPTTYGGTTFRSRTEARWAEWFDHQGIAWDYEPEWFKLRRYGRRVGYLPDFRLCDGRRVEIKGQQPTDEECWKCQQVADKTGHEVLLLAGSPGSATTYCFQPGARHPTVGPVDWATAAGR